MKKILFFLMASSLFLTAAIPPSEKAIQSSVNVSNYNEAKTVIENLKAEKLSIKEKAALKIATKSTATADGGGKSQLVAAVLAFLVGGLGIHRFYLGYKKEGIIQLLTAGGCGVWALIDLIRIITGDLKPKDGDYTDKF